MKKFLFILFIHITLSANARNLTAFLSQATFSSPSQGPYVETYLSVLGNSVKFVPTANGKFQGMIEVSIAFTQNAEIKNFKKYTLLSPEVADTVNPVNFIDQQRFFLPNGAYEIEIEIADKNSTSKSFKSKQNISLNYPENVLSFSDIEFIESLKKVETPTLLTKSGYDLVPYISTFYPDNLKKLSFYTEVYNVNKIIPEGEKFLLSYFIRHYESQVKVESFGRFSKETSQPINVIFGEFALDQLPSGNYELVVEVRNKQNEIIRSQKAFFQRKNTSGNLNADLISSIDIATSFVGSITDKDTLAEYIRSLRPISNQLEITFAENQLKSADLILMQKYFHNFWKTRDPLQPDQKWYLYNQEVQKVQKSFGTSIMKGYYTDRGRIYLQYGPPDLRNVVNSEPGTYPYEVWQYYKIARANRKFIFYNPDMVSNNYTLLHSDMPGENNDPMWQKRLNKRGEGSTRYNDSTTPDDFGNGSGGFNNPR